MQISCSNLGFWRNSQIFCGSFNVLRKSQISFGNPRISADRIVVLGEARKPWFPIISQWFWMESQRGPQGGCRFSAEILDCTGILRFLQILWFAVKCSDFLWESQICCGSHSFTRRGKETMIPLCCSNDFQCFPSGARRGRCSFSAEISDSNGILRFPMDFLIYCEILRLPVGIPDFWGSHSFTRRGKGTMIFLCFSNDFQWFPSGARRGRCSFSTDILDSSGIPRFPADPLICGEIIRFPLGIPDFLGSHSFTRRGRETMIFLCSQWFWRKSQRGPQG